eukprot:11067193-Alexandrium_andersonii.AAC.1
MIPPAGASLQPCPGPAARSHHCVLGASSLQGTVTGWCGPRRGASRRVPSMLLYHPSFVQKL